MKVQWKKLCARFDGLARRERALIAAAAAGGIFLIGYSLFIDPALIRNRNLRQNIERQSEQLATLQSQMVTLEAVLRADPDAGVKAEIAQLNQGMQNLDRELNQMGSTLVPPERMNLVLENLLRRNPGLRLVSFKTLAPTSLLAQPTEKDNGQKANKTEKESKPEAPVRDFDIFQHGVQIQLEGNFADLRTYVLQLEQSPQKFLWGEMRLEVVEYPRSILTLVVYTLSSDTAWLAI